ncbi:hypothetical protein ACFX2I_044874 [Malus domestica]
MVSDDLDVAVPATEDERFGFKRLEMFKEKLAGTVNAYDRHVLLCYKTPEAWPSCVEGSESVLLPKFFASALKARKNDIAVKFKEEAELRGLTNQVFVTACSHIGDHKCAGNLIVYSPGSDGSITGHWYGYVTPEDVPELLDQHIGKGDIIERLWRIVCFRFCQLSADEKFTGTEASVVIFSYC